MLEEFMNIEQCFLAVLNRSYFSMYWHGMYCNKDHA